MNAIKLGGVVLLALLWLWLSQAVLRSGGGFTLKNLLIIVMSGIIIFVPIWKKYMEPHKNEKR